VFSDKTTYDIFCSSGTVTVDEKEREGGYRKSPDDPTNSIKITAENATVNYVRIPN
jgi:hypothetical protein